jgi:hypothetical protein
MYDLYAVVNHIMYHNTGGGHYTSYVMSEQPAGGGNQVPGGNYASQPQLVALSNGGQNSLAAGGVQVGLQKGPRGHANQLWFKCNDSSISRIDKADVISKDAYILFYKRKEFSASNIINFTAPGGI